MAFWAKLEKNSDTQSGAERKENPTGGKAALVMALVCILYAVLAISEIAATWLNSPRFLPFLIGTDFKPTEDQKNQINYATYCALGSVVGATLISLKGLHRYAAEQSSFKSSFIGGYLVGPWGAGILGFAVFALTQGGLLAFGAGSNAAGQRDAAYLALGIMSGFGWRNVGEKIEEVIETLFAVSERKKRSGIGSPKTAGNRVQEAPYGALESPVMHLNFKLNSKD